VLELGSVDERLAAFLRAVVLARCNLMVAGATDAGKTTLLRALINCIPPHERLVTVERALELGLRRHPDLHPDVVELEEVLPSADGGGGVSIWQLVRRTRRHNPSRVIVGEVLGQEVVEMLSAMSQGNDGSLSTIHARDAADVFHRLATYAAQHEGLSFDVSHALIGSTIDFVVFIRKNPRRDGLRSVMEVLEVTGSADGRVTRSRIFTEGPDGRAVRDLSSHHALAGTGRSRLRRHRRRGRPRRARAVRLRPDVVGGKRVTPWDCSRVCSSPRPSAADWPPRSSC
jgi:Flp pilus assembly CpaF family ATPase